MYTNAWTGMFSTWNYCCHRKINLRKQEKRTTNKAGNLPVEACTA